jgi:hypothetical protein
MDSQPRTFPDLRRFLIATASVSDYACRGSRRLLKSDAPEPRRIFLRESAALPLGDDRDRRREIAADVPQLPQPWRRPPVRNVPQAPAECCHTIPGRPASRRSPRVSRRLGVSRFLKQSRPDLFPGDDIGRFLLVPSDAVIKLSGLRIRHGCRVRFRASHRVSSSSAFSAGERLFIWVRKSLIRLQP